MENGEKKSLQINCAVCDARYVQEETLAAYERVQINGAALITDERSQALLSKYAVCCNCAAVSRLESGEVRLCVSNGTEELRPHAAPAEPTYLVCNGRITVFPGAEDTLAGYVGITVNGTILCPESLRTRLPNVIVNGTMHTYPDDCIVLKSTLVLDRTFVLRARQGARYFAAGRVVALAPDIGAEKLAEKGVQFVTRRAIVAEGLAEAAMPLFDEQTDIVIVPDGCAFVDDDATLDRSLLRRYGGKLYINGDLEVAEGAGEALSEVKYLKVNGDVTVPAALEEGFHAIGAEYDGLTVADGSVLRGLSSVTVDRAMLELAKDGLSIAKCATVCFAEDLTPELIRERVHSITDCACVNCTEEQLGAVQLVSDGVGCFNQGPEDDGEDDRCVTVNAASYQL